jgi:hypothetical protein
MVRCSACRIDHPDVRAGRASEDKMFKVMRPDPYSDRGEDTIKVFFCSRGCYEMEDIYLENAKDNVAAKISGVGADAHVIMSGLTMTPTSLIRQRVLLDRIRSAGVPDNRMNFVMWAIIDNLSL